MAFGDTDLLKKTAQDLAASKDDTWAMNFGYQPGVVVMVFAFRKDGKIIAGDCPVRVEHVDDLIERIRLTKREAERARQ